MPFIPPQDGPSEPTRSVPQHVAIIMDGNHRWARQRGVPSTLGHRSGARNVRPIVEACADEGIRIVTLFAFSTENWARPRTEIDLLMALVRETLNRDLDALQERDAKLTFVGDLSRFPKDLQDLMRDSEAQTAGNTSFSLIIAMSYGGRWDLTNAAKQIARRVANGEMDPDDLDEGEFERHLSLAGIPSPDLCIRTGGDQRLSNFLLWNLAYTELFFTKTYWPDFKKSELLQAIYDYQRRQRRFGERASTTHSQAAN